MKQIFYIGLLIICYTINGQINNSQKDFILDLKTFKKDSLILDASVIEIFSRFGIDTGQTDFDGVDIFKVNSDSVIDNKIRIKIYGINCKHSIVYMKLRII